MIQQKSYLEQSDYHRIQELLRICQQAEPVSLKLELEYKMGDGSASLTGVTEKKDEFFYYEDEILVGYLGICSFGGKNAPCELTGMVHPDYRRRGIFTSLYHEAVSECQTRGAKQILLLCDHRSDSGQGFLEHIKAKYHNSEYEMYLRDAGEPSFEPREICFVKALNHDAVEIARQNAIYFDESTEEEGLEAHSDLMLPEEEEHRGMKIYLVTFESAIIGKVHLQLIDGTGSIYGFGVLPEYRRRGFGRSVLMKSIQMLKEEGADEILLQVAAENQKAMDLYSSCGFHAASIMDYFIVSDEEDPL